MKRMDYLRTFCVEQKYLDFLDAIQLMVSRTLHAWKTGT